MATVLVFKNQEGRKFAFKTSKEVLRSVGFDENGTPVYSTGVDKKGVVHIRGRVYDVKYTDHSPKEVPIKQ